MKKMENMISKKIDSVGFKRRKDRKRYKNRNFGSLLFTQIKQHWA